MVTRKHHIESMKLAQGRWGGFQDEGTCLSKREATHLRINACYRYSVLTAHRQGLILHEKSVQLKRSPNAPAMNAKDTFNHFDTAE